jgi:NADPH2:quinone reductase
MATARGVSVQRGSWGTPEDMRRITESVLAEAAAGQVALVIGQRFPPAAAAEAHRAIESGATVGKSLLVV